VEVRLSNRINKKVRLVGGWGINDVDYNITKSEIVNGKHINVWTCPYYRDWRNMILRCYNDKYQKRNPSYIGCSITEEWRYLSNFIKWVDSQPNRDWQNCELDKDILYKGNKCYSPDTCVYITKMLNNFILECDKARGELLLGVKLRRDVINQPYSARCRNPFLDSKTEHLGYFTTELNAHLAWKAKKHEHACKLAELQKDERVSKRLKEMYL
jgi:hypothetical protein